MYFFSCLVLANQFTVHNGVFSGGGYVAVAVGCRQVTSDR